MLLHCLYFHIGLSLLQPIILDVKCLHVRLQVERSANLEVRTLLFSFKSFTVRSTVMVTGAFLLLFNAGDWDQVIIASYCDPAKGNRVQ